MVEKKSTKTVESIEKKFNWKKYKYYLLVGVIVLILAGVFQNQIRQVGSFIFGITIDKTISLGNQENEDFSVLILGIGGGDHEAPNLTDTIIYSNISVSEKRVDLISIPRDLWIDSLKAKINAIYAFGKKEDKGVENVKKAVEQIVGSEIDYVLIIDFQVFVNLVDHLGGIEVDVERSFEDYGYPISGKEIDSCGFTNQQIIDFSIQITTGSAKEAESFPCRYKTLSFDKGLQIMDGDTALTYVRSRHGTNDEGSDFARSRRQQNVIDALRKKALSLEFLLNPIRVIGAFNIVKRNIVTDIHTEELDDFIKLGQKLQNGKIRSFVIDEGDVIQDRPGLLVTPQRLERYLYQYVLVPRIGEEDFSEIHEYIKCIKSGEVCIVTNTGVATPTQIPTEEPDKQ